MRKLILGLLCLSLSPVFADSFLGLLDGSESPDKVTESANNKCLRYKTITVVTQKDEDAPGDQILIKTGDDASCSWDNAAGWETDSGEASYFLGKWKNLIFIDRGTGADGRDVLIFDLDSKHQVFAANYSEPLEISSKKLTYWQGANILATKDNCDEFEDAEKSGLTPQIQKLMSVDLTTATPVALGSKKMRCKLTQ
ncbi:MAG: hypothetical protein K2X04_02080 [Burkholderiales bacterium]|nr:hypothetical protein [Burkholderiales bacterium]